MRTGNILVLDVGGSFLKYGVADEKGALLPGSVGEVPAGRTNRRRKSTRLLRKSSAGAGDCAAGRSLRLFPRPL